MQLPSILSIKNAIIVLVLAALAFVAYSYVQVNGNNVAWCATNINACRVARIQALERDISVLSPSK